MAFFAESSTGFRPSDGNTLPCLFCGSIFTSLQALEEHRKADHLSKRNQQHQRYLMKLRILENLPNTVREEPIRRPAPPIGPAPPPNAVAFSGVRDQEIDLELRLCCGPPPEPPKPYCYYEFIPIHGSGSSSPEKIYDMRSKRYCPYPPVKPAGRPLELFPPLRPLELFPDLELPLMGGGMQAMHAAGHGCYLQVGASNSAGSSLSSTEACFIEDLTLNEAGIDSGFRTL